MHLGLVGLLSFQFYDDFSSFEVEQFKHCVIHMQLQPTKFLVLISRSIFILFLLILQILLYCSRVTLLSKELRPTISLCNLTYKFGSKTLENRLAKVVIKCAF